MAVYKPSADDLRWFRERTLERLTSARLDLATCRWWQFARRWQLRDDIMRRETDLADIDAQLAELEGGA